MTFAIGIVAHMDRVAMAEKLCAETGALIVNYDDGTLGCTTNHVNTWKRLAEEPVDFCVVLEDDAQPVDGFLEQLTKVLESAPSETPIISFYLGQKRPPQYQHLIGSTIQRATEWDAHWITSTLLLHAVGVAIRTELVKPMLDGLVPELPIDEAIGHWAACTGHRIAYCHPSIVNHDDGPSLVSHRDHQVRTAGRVAWRVGTREFWNPIGQVRMN